MICYVCDKTGNIQFKDGRCACWYHFYNPPIVADGAIGGDDAITPACCHICGAEAVGSQNGKYHCKDHKPRPTGLGMFKSDTELTGLEIKPKRKR